MRQTYRMTDEQHEKLLDACKPTICMWVGGPPRSPQENANAAWQTLGDELGFQWDTVQPVGRDSRDFTAELAEPAREGAT